MNASASSNLRQSSLGKLSFVRQLRSAIRFDSTQFDSIRFDSIQYNSIQSNKIRFDSIWLNGIQFNDSINNNKRHF